MKTLTFFGASGMVTGSSYLLSDEAGTRILVDMGMFQGTAAEERYNYEQLRFDPRTVTAVVLTHAHLDHCGRLPLLVKHGFTGHFYMTRATKQLLEIVLLDSVKIAVFNGSDDDGPTSYGPSDVDRVLKRTIMVEYHRPFGIGRYEGEFFDAGHILGSASVLFTDKSGDAPSRIAFSGDLGNSPQDLVRPTEHIPAADVVLLESTYGDRLHPEESARDMIAEEIQRIRKNDGTLLIPSFSIERTQTILHMIGHMKEEGRIAEDLPVFLDGPMARKVTAVYRKFPALYNTELAAHAKKSDPFDFPGLTVVVHPQDIKKLKKHDGTKIIIAGSGMMSGGRILAHAKRLLPRKSTRLLFVGYQGEQTLGRQILEGDRDVWIDGAYVHIDAAVSQINSMSAHADQSQLLMWLRAINGAKSVFLIHGENGPREALAQKIKDDLDISSVHLPAMYQEFPLN